MEKKNLDLFAEFPIPTYEEWREVTEKSLKGASFEKKLVTNTYEQISLQPMYQKKDIADLPHLSNIPGQTPFLRGTKAVYSERAWEVNQELNEAVPNAWNESARHDLERGQTSLNIVLDEVVKVGIDPLVAQAVGKTGLLISSKTDLEAALANINLKNVPVHVHTGANALPLIALFAATFTNDLKDVSGCIGMDPIGESVRTGGSYYDESKLFDQMAQLVNWASEHAPNLQTVIVNGNPYHNGGSSATEELAFVLATGIEYLRALTERGVAINVAAKAFRFIFAVGSDYFMEIAKLRAARLLWAKIVKAFGGDEEAQKMTIHARTSAWTKTVYDPYVNMLRSTSEAFAAAVGGADSIHVSPFDEAIQKSTPFSRRIARNASIILQEESYIGHTVDPAGGSWYVESLTDQVAEKAWELLQQVEAKGGITASLQASEPQQIVAKTLQKRLSNIETRKDIFVGTNMYANLTEKPLDVVAEDEKPAIKQLLSEWKAKPEVAVAELNSVEEAIQLAAKGATLSDLATAFGRKENAVGTIEPIVATRGAEKFEQLRKRTEQFAKETGKVPQIFLANLGSIPSHKARADFAAAFFEIGGFEVIRNNGFETASEVAQAALQSGADVTVICGKDESYEEMAEQVAAEIKASAKEMTVMLAGLPSEEKRQSYEDAGIEEFIHLRANCLEVLHNLQVKKGVVK